MALSQPQISPLQHLLNGPMREGRLVWIGVRPGRHEPVLTPPSATLIAARGIAQDRYQTARNGTRQVTLISMEDLAAIASYLGRDTVAPELLRRNFVTQGLNLGALKDRRFHVGPVLLEYSGVCAPCSQMETLLGPGGYNAVRGHGGITARILQGGEVRIGDAITRAAITPAD